MTTFLGLDFGTTNSAIAASTPEGTAIMARFASPRGPVDTFRSILHFSPERRDSLGVPVPFAGPAAIVHYLESEGNGRLIQSMKTHLSSRGFRHTQVFGRNFTLEDLVAAVVRGLSVEALPLWKDAAPVIVAGRPVRFARAESEGDDAFAEERLRRALHLAGFPQVVFEYEPVAAAWHYEEGLDHREMVLIGDFGGGTSDFSLLEVGPGAATTSSGTRQVLATSGVGIAGDTFDSRIMRHVVAPRLGRGSTYGSALGDKMLPVPAWLYTSLNRWHHLSFLKTRETAHLLDDIHARASDRLAIASLIHVIEDDLGYRLYRAVERVKTELSQKESSRFVFRDPPVYIDTAITRTQFEEWIAEDVAAIAACVDEALTTASLSNGDVDRVFLTGGTSLVPAVRRVFTERFGEEKIRTGNALTSVARGLALRAREVHLGR